ncbi:putative pentatricopeptide repeat-containing protein At5g52630 [Apium graveolens]|uniref:putative pentatricopeptide repeat-containing protein At5g52630 n=1 Tax=Apium graveolens TaxID=4045 RepID=UPI003D79DD47
MSSYGNSMGLLKTVFEIDFVNIVHLHHHGKTSHLLVLKSGMDKSIFIRSVVIDAYCKCGSIGGAETAFRNKDQHNVAVWIAMMGYAQCQVTEHYACAVDVLGRVGLFEEANLSNVYSPCCPYMENSFISMQSSWTHIDLGQFAASKILGLQPENFMSHIDRFRRRLLHS